MAGKRAFIVLGMHRSGTSSVAGVLTLLGAAPPRTMMAVAVDNPKGFFESRLVGELNDRILEAAGSSWDDWRRLNPSLLSPEATAAFQDEIRDTLRHEFADDPVVVLKDPRLCRLYPLWEEVLAGEGYRADFVLPIRSPLEVAKSLNRRNGMPIAGGLLLWLRHVLEAEELTRGLDRRIMLWRAFMQDWRSEVALIQKALGWQAEVTEARSSEVDAFLSADLQHEVVPDLTLGSDPEAHAWALEAYEALSDLATGAGEASASLARLDTVRSAFEVACQLYGRASQPLKQRIGELEAELASAQRSVSEVMQKAPEDSVLARRRRMERAIALASDVDDLTAIGTDARKAVEAALERSEVHLRSIQRVRRQYAS